MGKLRKLEDKIKDVGRKIDDEIIEPVKENPEVALGVALMFVPGLQGIGASLGSALGASGAVATGIGNAIIQGALTEAQGGDFLKGAALSGLGSVAGGFIQPGLSEALGGGAFGNIAADALIGGGMSEISGGDFTSGALISGIGSGINQAKLSAADDYLNSLPGGHGPYTDDLPDMSGFDVPPTLADISDFPVQNFGVPIDVDTDFYRNPTATAYFQNDDGTMSYTWDDGSTITVDDSFNIVNFTQATDSAFSVPKDSSQEASAKAPKDIDLELALLDAAKSLTPWAVGSLLAKNVIKQSDNNDKPTGFAIVPIPTDWRSPEYNMAFTPSAPIDFGSPEMLAGTQFARQPQAATPSFYNLSDVINTLNYQSVPFVQQQYQMPEQSFSVPDILQQFQTNPNVGMNETIGNLDGSPATLNSIIAGIQSQYG